MMKLWEECILPESKTPQLAEAQCLFALALSTWKKVQDRVQAEVGREEQGIGEDTRKGTKRETERTNAQATAHMDEMSACKCEKM